MKTRYVVVGVERHMDDMQEPQVRKEQGEEGVEVQIDLTGYLGSIGT